MASVAVTSQGSEVGWGGEVCLESCTWFEKSEWKREREGTQKVNQRSLDACRCRKKQITKSNQRVKERLNKTESGR